MNIRTDSRVVRRKWHVLVERRVEVCLFETIRIGRHRRIRTLRNEVVRERWPSLDHLDRRDNLQHRLKNDFTTAISDVGVIHVVQEDAFLFVLEPTFAAIDIILEQNPTPITRGCRRRKWIVVGTNGLVVDRRKDHIIVRHT